MLDVIVGQSTDPGKLRAGNDDAMGAWIPKSPTQARSQGWIFVVADGAGENESGEIAAANTVATLLRGFAEASAGEPLPTLLQQMLQAANEEVHNASTQPGPLSMPTVSTAVACAVRHDQAVIAHVGDSRCYHLREGKVLFVTRDHNVANEQQRGLADTVENLTSDARKILTRSVGLGPSVTVDTATLSIQAGDALLLCSDGLHGGIYDEDILRIICATADPQKAADDLVRYAVEVDGSDNATAQVLRILEVEAPAP